VAEHVHIFSGSGLDARDLGDFGTPCGLFDNLRPASSADTILVYTADHHYRLRFDPGTGASIDHIDRSCDG
jgi:hypothetical protein